MKTSNKKLYVSPDTELLSIRSEAGFAISYDPNENTENIGSYDEETL